MLTSAVIVDLGNMCDRVKLDGLVSRVIAGHVALSTVDAHVLKKNEKMS